MPAASAPRGNGLYRDRGFLVVDFQTPPTFPMKCMFTNEPITELSTIKVHIPRGRSLGGMLANDLFNKLEFEMELPVGENWKGSRSATANLIGKLLWWGMLIALIVGAVLLAISIPLPRTALVKQIQLAGVICASLAIPLGIVAAAWPNLELPISPELINASRIDPPYIWIYGVHRDFLNDLPAFEHPAGSLQALLFGKQK